MEGNVKCDIVKHIVKLSDADDRGYTKELNLVSWNGREPKYDIRCWTSDHERMSKGVTLSEEEFELMISAVKEML